MKHKIKGNDDGSLTVTIYCPICGHDIEADNVEEVRRGENDGFIFVHDEITHSESDVDALNSGVN